MFAAFFYLLRQRGLHVSLNEWMTLLEGMEKGLHHSTLTGFYHLCRAIVVKNETEFDRFDQIFLEFFKNVPYTGELPEDLLDWLNHPSEDLKRTIADLRSAGFPDETLEELLKTEVRKLSGGMKRRLSIACALAQWPPILLLDEPTTALDLYYKDNIQQWLMQYRSMNGIVLLTSHDENEILSCDRCLIMKQGKLTELMGEDLTIEEIRKEIITPDK